MADAHEATDSYGKMLLGTTPKGKEVYMVRKYNRTVRFIEFGSGGQLPECLQGGYSSIQLAQKAVTDYLDRVETKQIDEAGKELKKAKAK